MVKDPWFPVIALLLIAVCTWLGIAGPLVNAIVKAEPGEWLSFFGNIIAAAMTLAAAIIAWRAIQPQLAELRRQSSQRQYEQLRARARELENEKHLLMRLLAALEMAAHCLREYAVAAGTSALAYATAHLQSAERGLRGALDDAKSGLGAPWGQLVVQMARRQAMSTATRYCNVFTPFVGKTSNLDEIPREETRSTIADLQGLHDLIVAHCMEIHRAADTELGRIGERIAEMETELL